MNTQSKTGIKKTYDIPEIRQVQLDNEISLQLQSNPLPGPNETLNNQSNVDDPFKMNV